MLCALHLCVCTEIRCTIAATCVHQTQNSSRDLLEPSTWCEVLFQHLLVSTIQLLTAVHCLAECDLLSCSASLCYRLRAQTSAASPPPTTTDAGIEAGERECAALEFFYKDCSRLEAEAILQSKSNGSFLLRQGAVGNPIVLSGVWYSRCWHYKIFHKPLKGYFLAPTHRGFATIRYLIQHYMSTSLPSPADAASDHVAMLVSSVLLQR
eukprot:m.673309 g.673309  ORF g.673309 m.673309 type:complete len:209 (-) comp22782_c0_seq1:3890-4516(-)